MLSEEDPPTPLITDFETSKSLEAQDCATKTLLFMGTPHYADPSLLKGAEASALSDMYSVGVIMYEMLTGHPRVDQGLPHFPAESWQAKLTSLIACLTSPNLSERLTASQCLSHEAVKDEPRLANCQIAACCAGKVPEAEALFCSGPCPHAVCTACLNMYITSLAQEDPGKLEARDGNIPCPGRDNQNPALLCPSRCWEDVEVVSRIEPEAYWEHLRARRRLLELRMARNMDAEYQKRLTAELERLMLTDEKTRRSGSARLAGGPSGPA
eukprot:GILI01033165.1.p1 GENE.GILI01033165.1~~GILI01033165.1.p1  ORF type:complete len:304 (-),score=66.40 GILI01033165.1:227-1033(-)